MCRAALLWIACWAAGCSDSLARPSELAGPRVLAIGAEPTGAPPGETVSVEALVWTPGTGARSLRWSICLAPEDGSIDRCAGEETVLQEGTDLTAIEVVAPDEIATHLLRLELCAETSGADGACPGEPVLAARRLVVAEDEPTNGNPILESLDLEPPDADGDRPLVATVAAGSAEETQDGTEELLVSWFATAGELADDRAFTAPDRDRPERFETTWSPGREAEAAVTFFAVLRDGRGGVAWASTRTE